ncbi:hypothetical protein PILCRDRAFT_821808 [Piloderma croceum F 1598]|uniref:Extracellular membrane protein CFEM domain-containing protein n=1 Tax=Piloderma croceum (strain F 1598) TaxID=765440 RepID=A0A0C3FME9_PILCF|nr:hypothetical protein PILCRDRAFT_821808 [Piloderma croceum F 1598]
MKTNSGVIVASTCFLSALLSLRYSFASSGTSQSVNTFCYLADSESGCVALCALQANRGTGFEVCRHITNVKSDRLRPYKKNCIIACHRENYQAFHREGTEKVYIQWPQ